MVQTSEIGEVKYSITYHLHLYAITCSLSPPLSHPEKEAYLSEPFACGHAFLSSVFDSMTTVAFHSPTTIKLLEGLLGITKQQSTDYGKVIQLSVEVLYSSHQLARDSNYSTLYDMLTKKGLICVGLYRKLADRKHDSQRYVITAPPPDICVLDSDIVLALTSTNWSTPTSSKASVSELVASTSMNESTASLLPCQTEINLEYISLTSDNPAEQA